VSDLVIRRTGEVVNSKTATAEQCRAFAVDVRDRIPDLTEDELDQLEAALVAVARRLKQLGKDSAEAERSRALTLRRIGDLLGPAEHGGDRRSADFELPDGNLNAAERKRRHSARLLSEFAELVDAELAKDKPVSLSRLVKICQRKRSARDVPMPDRRYSILYVDPPWRYEHDPGGDGGRQVENQYGTMSLDAIKAMEVPAAEDAVLFCWTTSPKLAEGLAVVKAWDFTYRTCMVWVKDRIGMGYYARQQHELLLIGTRGTLPAPAPENRPPSVFYGDRTEHSAKPDAVYELIEAMYPEYDRTDDLTEFCELFSRRPRKGWFGWGNEAQVAS
jgi:N6-adenosine-specific RNA methylase IME4